jgi:hypothetical protein
LVTGIKPRWAALMVVGLMIDAFACTNRLFCAVEA